MVALKLYDLNCVGKGSGGYEERNRMLAHMKSCSGAVIFYDVGSKTSFSMLKTHLDDLLALSSECVLYFVGNRKPGSRREVESEGALEFARGLDGGWAELDVTDVGSVVVVLQGLAEKMDRLLASKASMVSDSRGNARPALPPLDTGSKARAKAPTEKPLWLEDESASACMRCCAAFTQTRRKVRRRRRWQHWGSAEADFAYSTTAGTADSSSASAAATSSLVSPTWATRTRSACASGASSSTTAATSEAKAASPPLETL